MRASSGPAVAWCDDRGSVTAEFALVLPAVMLVLGLVLGSLFLMSERLVLTEAAGEIARLEARGDRGAAAGRLAGLPVGVTVTREQTAALHCVSLKYAPGEGMLAAFVLQTSSCAAHHHRSIERVGTR